MNWLEFSFFGLCTLFVIVGGIATVAAPNPIRGAMGLLATIIGIAGLYLMLSAEFLAAIQVLVYAGAVVVLFLFVIMLIGPNATIAKDARGAASRYLGAGAFLLSGALSLVLIMRLAPAPEEENPALKDLTEEQRAEIEERERAVPADMGSVEAVGREMFSRSLVPFELAGVLLLVAVVGAVALARGKQPDPTLTQGPKDPRASKDPLAPKGALASASKEPRS